MTETTTVTQMIDPNGNPLFSVWNQCIAAAIERTDPDIYHACDFHGALAPLYLLARRSTPAIATCHLPPTSTTYDDQHFLSLPLPRTRSRVLKRMRTVLTLHNAEFTTQWPLTEELVSVHHQHPCQRHSTATPLPPPPLTSLPPPTHPHHFLSIH